MSVDPAAINTICKAGNASGETEERQSGNVYLDITSEDAWTITIQELKKSLFLPGCSTSSSLFDSCGFVWQCKTESCTVIFVP